MILFSKSAVLPSPQSAATLPPTLFFWTHVLSTGCRNRAWCVHHSAAEWQFLKCNYPRKNCGFSTEMHPGYNLCMCFETFYINWADGISRLLLASFFNTKTTLQTHLQIQNETQKQTKQRKNTEHTKQNTNQRTNKRANKQANNKNNQRTNDRTKERNKTSGKQHAFEKACPGWCGGVSPPPETNQDRNTHTH